MSEWKEVKLGDVILHSCSGGTPKSNVSEYYDGEIPWLNTKEIDFNRIYQTERNITQKGLDNSSAKWIDEKCVIIAMYGATAGKIAINMIPLTTNQACCNLKVDDRLADFRYIYYFLKKDFKFLASLANGGAQQNLNSQIIKDYVIKLPSLSIQKEISDLLWTIDAKIETNNKLNEKLEEMAQAIFKSWFVDFEPFKDKPFLETELGMIPEGWEVGIFEDVVDIVGGGTPSKSISEYYTDNGIAWITPKDLSLNNNKFTSKGTIDITELGYEKSSAKLMPKGSVLFSSRAPIGYITIAKNEICTNQGFKSAVPKKAGTAFVYYLLKNKTIEIENMATGSTFKEASGTLMKNLKIIIPLDKVLDDFEKIMMPIFEFQMSVEEQNDRLASLRDTLLPRLMSGELKV